VSLRALVAAVDRLLAISLIASVIPQRNA